MQISGGYLQSPVQKLVTTTVLSNPVTFTIWERTSVGRVPALNRCHAGSNPAAPTKLLLNFTKGDDSMQRRCTQSSCRRVFPIGRTAPVRCPYCGTAYPRIQPDPRSAREAFGYSILADFADHPHVPVRRFFPQYQGWARFFWSQPLAVGRHLSLREAQQICQQFRREGIPADVISTRYAQRQYPSFFRI